MENIDNQNEQDTHGLHKICCHGAENEKGASSGKKPGWFSNQDHRFLGICIIVAAAIVGWSWFHGLSSGKNAGSTDVKIIQELKQAIFPEQGVVLPVVWKDLGERMIESGVIDLKKIENLYEQRGEIDDQTRRLLLESDNGQLVINEDNADIILNLLWALGLGNKNQILEKGPMMDKQYGGNAGSFASTGGWILASGNAMNHYSRHKFISLTPEQQNLVERVSKNIYRPCCGNSTHFPDCNHGMAMLGLLELMASQGVSESDMYKAALVANSYWFPDTYLTIAIYMRDRGIEWKKVNPQEILGANYSSATGYANIAAQVTKPQQRSGSGCGV